MTKSKLSFNNEKEIYVLLHLEFTKKEICKKFGITESVLNYILHKIQKNYNKYFKKGNFNIPDKIEAVRKYTDEEKYTAYKLRMQGLEFLEVSNRTGMCLSYIQVIIKNEDYKKRYELEKKIENKIINKDQLIREKAYSFYQTRIKNNISGNEKEDWRLAELFYKYEM